MQLNQASHCFYALNHANDVKNGLDLGWDDCLSDDRISLRMLTLSVGSIVVMTAIALLILAVIKFLRQQNNNQTPDSKQRIPHRRNYWHLGFEQQVR